MNQIFLISAQTGCTCCSDQNHLRGPYRTREDAQRRIDYYLNPQSKFWPLASQFCARGRYSIREVNVETLCDGRFIFNGKHVANCLEFIEVNEDGTIENDKLEGFYDIPYHDY